MRSAARRRREAALPVSRPNSAERVAVFDTVSESMPASSNCHTGKGKWGRIQGFWPPSGFLGLVFAVEEFRDAGLVENGREGIGDDLGHGKDLDLVEHLLGRQRQCVGENDPGDGGV